MKVLLLVDVCKSKIFWKIVLKHRKNVLKYWENMIVSKCPLPHAALMGVYFVIYAGQFIMKNFQRENTLQLGQHLFLKKIWMNFLLLQILIFAIVFTQDNKIENENKDSAALTATSGTWEGWFFKNIERFS
jgi:hypothetical protein